MSIGKLLGVIAPWLASASMGPFGGMAVEAVSKVFRLTDKTENAIKNALSGATPEQMLALKVADQEFSVKMQELGFNQITDLENIAAADRSSARDMQKTIRSWVPAVLSIGVTTGYFTILIGMMLGWLIVDDSQALLIMLGSLGTAWGMIMAFWFGTTSSSAQKTDIIAQSQPIGK